MNHEVITPTEVAALNAARKALEAIGGRNHGTTAHGSASLADNAVFTVLNHCHSYLGADLTHVELHGRESS